VSHLDPKAATETYGRGAPGAPIATVSLSVDFAGTARKGDWVEVHVDVQRVGGTLAYASAYLHLGDERIGRASGVFRILNKRS
jgi:acyl-coenzyme A thioesterase PaaI-like protein